MRPLLLLLALSLSLTIEAKRFTSKYCEFELPPGWDCALEGAEYVCQSENADRKKESIIILAAKVRGEQDNLDEYMTFLKRPKEYMLPGGKKQISEVKNVKLTKIGEDQWVDALHLASEVPGFYTRYLVAVKEDIGVAVTFSVSKDLYTAYAPIMEKLISTLKVFRQTTKNNLNPIRSDNSVDQTEDYSNVTFKPSTSLDLQVNKTQKRQEKSSGDDELFYLLIFAAAIVGVIIIKKKKKK